MSDSHLQRAQLLLDQSRYDLAERELRQLLVVDPNSSRGHGLLSFCLSRLERYKEATEEARQAIHLAPDEPFGHFALACVLSERKHYDQAEEALKAAIALDPFQPDFFATLSQTHLAREQWQAALDAAEEGLAVNPEHIDCTNLRVMALVKLGRKTVAAEAVQTALEIDPNDAVTHANLGWTLIEQGQHKQALEHFRDALRIDPEMEWARLGIVEALKARHFLYRIMLSYFLWMMKLSGQARWGLVIGGYVGFVMLRNLARNQPDLAPWIMPFLILYIAFVVMTWIASPLFNLLLRLNRFGRMALSREEIITSNWVGFCVLGVFAAVAGFFLTGADGAIVAAFAFGLTIPALSVVYRCDEGWPRTAMILIAVGVGGMGLLSAGLISLGPLLAEGNNGVRLANIGQSLFMPFLLCAIGSQFAANALVGAVVRK